MNEGYKIPVGDLVAAMGCVIVIVFALLGLV